MLTTVVVGAVALTSDPESLTTTAALTVSPARVLPEDASPVAVALLSRVDLAVLRVTTLLGIGIGVVGGVPRGRGLMAAGLVWLAGTLLALAGAARQVALQ